MLCFSGCRCWNSEGRIPFPFRVTLWPKDAGFVCLQRMPKLPASVLAELAAKTVSWAPLLVPNHVVSYRLSTLWSLTLLLRVFTWHIPPCHSVEAKCKGIHTKLLVLFPWCTGAVVQPLNIVTWCHQQSVWGRTVPMDYKVNLKNTHNVLSVWPLW